jgi:SAM-dependent methyltransferase
MHTLKYDRETSYYENRLKMVQDYPLFNSGKVCLNFGCGPMILEGWRNIDKYYGHPNVIKADVGAPNWAKDVGISDSYSVDLVFSSHFLEHVPFHVARSILKTWYTVLKPSGRMVLVVPDLENIMKGMMDKEISFEIRYEWLMLAMYGYQRDPNIPWAVRSDGDSVDPGQIHYCGFTKEFLQKYLTDIGFIIEDLWTYDGYHTPSLFCQVIKK